MQRPPVVIDNGGYRLRAGLAGLREPMCDILNATARVEKQINTLVGDEIETTVQDKSQLRYTRPVQRGYIVDFDTQKTIWERVIKELLEINPHEHALLLTQPYFNPSTVTKYLCELVFDEFGFQSLGIANREPLAFIEHLGVSASEYVEELKQQPGTNQIVEGLKHLDDILKLSPAAAAVQLPSVCHCGLVMDSGFSFSHAVPIIHGSPFIGGVRRVDVGGKYMTNYLKDTISYRQWNIQDAFDEANRIKEQVCYVSRNFSKVWPLAHKLASSNTLAVLEAAYARCCPGAEQRKGKASTYEITAWADALVHAAGQQNNDNIDFRSIWSGKGLTRKNLPKEAKKYIEEAMELYEDDIKSRDLSGVGYGLRREYVLPDHLSFHEGYCKGSSTDPFAENRLRYLQPKHDQGNDETTQDEEPDTDKTTAIINCERVAVPETLFSPGFTGLDQGGIVDAIERAINACPPDYQPLLWNNVVVTGGNANIPGIKERLYDELRTRCPADIPLRVRITQDPSLSAWKGASGFAASPQLPAFSVSKQEYQKHGFEYVEEMLRDKSRALGKYIFDVPSNGS